MKEINKKLRGNFLNKFKIVKPYFEQQMPYTLEVHPTYRCNYKCEFCIDEWLKNVPSTDGKKINCDGKSQLNKENMDTIITGCKELGIKGIILSGGGDPPLNQHTKYLVQQSNENGISIGMFTNGFALDEISIYTYINHLTFLRFSFDSFDPKNYAKTKGVSESAYWKVLENIKMCTKYKAEYNAKCKIGIDFIIQPHNVHLIPEIYQKARELDVDYLQFCDCVIPGYEFTDKQKEKILVEIDKCLNYDREKYNSTFTTANADLWVGVAVGGMAQDEIKQMYEESEQNRKQRMKVEFEQFKHPLEIVYEPAQVENTTNCQDCKMKDYIFQVGGDGGVRVCPHTARFDHWLYGNINEQSLKEIWDNRRKDLDDNIYEYCRFREQNKILDGLEHIEHGDLL